MSLPASEPRSASYRAPDIRDWEDFLSYFFWPERERLTRWGFELLAARTWDHNGAVLSGEVEPSIE
jgi:hypothetical protein